MIKGLKPLHIAATVAIALVTGGASIAIGQSSANEAADAAEQVAEEAVNAIRAIDPTTGGESLVVDPSLPQPYGAQVAPELPVLDEPVAQDAPEMAANEPPRGPAARMISNPQVQSLPAPQPTARVPTASRELASSDPFVIKSILPIEGTIRYGEWYWDESRAPKKGKLVITVDLDARVISAFRDGHEIGTAVALLGTQKHPTPLGSFPILTKEKDNVSEKYDNAPMPWTLRLTWDGIAIHGSPVMNGYASHGCIGVPDPFAEKLFAIAKRGDKVIITRGKMIAVGDKLS
ncbi:L,D-transpeptidase family protein [Erythrobacter sp. JK5]|uniref:L,D-transpeptidase family protein n=1 Tax=Erythrobacter sp. JK5 TaxID=2829500 RepID=UPI001BAB85BA|nr:L,D-transpeptidase family protein [Erythrobacter sp. JK5]QUL36690.1 L,D-transpeptidase family protein [Erythrobacter sp. JK5]